MNTYFELLLCFVSGFMCGCVGLVMMDTLRLSAENAIRRRNLDAAQKRAAESAEIAVAKHKARAAGLTERRVDFSKENAPTYVSLQDMVNNKEKTDITHKFISGGPINFEPELAEAVENLVKVN